MKSNEDLPDYCFNIEKELLKTSYPAGIYMLKVNKTNIRTKYEICSKLTIKTPERLQ